MWNTSNKVITSSSLVFKETEKKVRFEGTLKLECKITNLKLDNHIILPNPVSFLYHEVIKIPVVGRCIALPFCLTSCCKN